MLEKGKHGFISGKTALKRFEKAQLSWKEGDVSNTVPRKLAVTLRGCSLPCGHGGQWKLAERKLAKRRKRSPVALALQSERDGKLLEEKRKTSQLKSFS